MSFRLKVGLLVGIFLITAFAFAQNGEQTQPAATFAVTQPATAAALPNTPVAAQQAAAMPVKPPLGITYGLDGRWRSDNYNNLNDLTNAANDQYDFLRVRTRLFATVDLSRDVSGYIRMAMEPYKRWDQTCTSTTAPCGLNGLAGKTISLPFYSADIWFDNAFLLFKRLPLLGSNATLQVGRQDWFEGEGWFAFCGTPGSGPKEGFWDAIHLSYTQGKQKLELVATENDRTDNYFPVINQTYSTSPTVGAASAWTNNDLGDLGGIIAYYTNRQFKSTDFDLYYSFDTQNSMLPIGAGGFSGVHWQPNRHWNGFGGRAVERLPDDIIAHGNLTYETGTQDAMTQAGNNPLLPGLTAADGISGYPKVNIRAVGADWFVTKYWLKTPLKPFIGYIGAYLSGSNPKKPKTDGDFIMAFGEWGQQNHPGPFMENGYPIPAIYDDAIATVMQDEIGVAPMCVQDYKMEGFRAGFTAYQGKVRSIQVIGTFHDAGAPHPFMYNTAHYNPNPAANATPQQLLTPVVGTTGIAGINGAGATTLFNNTTLGSLHRFNGYEVDIESQLAKTVTGFIWFDRLDYGNFYASSWKTYQYTGALAPVTAYRSAGNQVRLELDYRFTGFLPWKKAPKA